MELARQAAKVIRISFQRLLFCRVRIAAHPFAFSAGQFLSLWPIQGGSRFAGLGVHPAGFGKLCCLRVIGTRSGAIALSFICRYRFLDAWLHFIHHDDFLLRGIADPLWEVSRCSVKAWKLRIGMIR